MKVEKIQDKTKLNSLFDILKNFNEICENKLSSHKLFAFRKKNSNQNQVNNYFPTHNEFFNIVDDISFIFIKNCIVKIIFILNQFISFQGNN